MAVVHLALVRVGSYDQNGKPMPVANSRPLKSVIVNSTGSSVLVPNIIAPEKGAFSGLCWVVTATGGDVDIAFAKASPDAAGDKTHRVLAGTKEPFAVEESGEQAAIKSAS